MTKKYAIMFCDTGELLKLHSDGVIQRTLDNFEAKLMPTAFHANQLAKSVLKNIFTYVIIEIVAERGRVVK
jgi:hypothetical protein